LQQLLTATRQCPGGWHRVGNSCFFVPNLTGSFNTAQSICARLAPGGHLATIQPSSQLAIEHILEISGNTSYIRIGLFRDDQGGWSWIDGSSVGRIPWGAGQPDNSPRKEGETEDCVVWARLWARGARLIDAPCNHTDGILCQLDLGA